MFKLVRGTSAWRADAEEIVVTAITKKPDNPIAHLSPEDIKAIGDELQRIRQSVVQSRGAEDAAYIHGIIEFQRKLELASRLVLLASAFPPAWILGTLGLSVSKILDNMEIGHNVMHGQWDWMRDPKIHSSTWEWDNASTAEGWKHSHNVIHHTYTNIVGKDNDLGYGIMRVDEDQRWYPLYLAQPVWNFINACFFEYGIAAYDLELGKNLRVPKEKRSEQFKSNARNTLAKIRKQATKDYVVWPAVSLPFGAAVPTLAANFTANVVRNVWAHSVIMCGHFPEGVATYELKAIPKRESRGEWYLRQMLGSANISGSPLMHIMTGNLSHQIEHHLFSDLPSNRYAEIAPQVRALFEKYGLQYHEAPLPRQVGSAWHKVIRLSLPNDFLATTNRHNVKDQAKILYAMTFKGARARRAGQARLTQQARKQSSVAEPEDATSWA